MSDTEWVPTQGANTRLYEPQYHNGYEWKRVPVSASDYGVPRPAYCAGLAHQIGLFGYEDAHALAWMYAASVASTKYLSPAIRVVPYETVYDIKCRAIEGDAISLNNGQED